MIENMINAIANAIENKSIVRITSETGRFGFTTHFVPDYMEIGVDEIIIYSSEDIYVICISDITYDNDLEHYVCEDKSSKSPCYVFIKF